MPREKPNGFIGQMADQARWANGCSCVDENPKLFDTVRTNKLTVIDDDVRAARDICADCPVMLDCLAHAIRFDMRDGVWGGMVYEERVAWALQHHPEWLPASVRAQAQAEASPLAIAA